MGFLYLRDLGPILEVEIFSVSRGKDSPKVEGWALLDTGAESSSLDVRACETLGLICQEEKEAYTAIGVEKVWLCEGVRFEFPRSRLKNAHAREVMKAKLANRVSKESPHKIDAIIGRDILANWVLIWNGPESSFTAITP